jgi:O-antigen/teichoic acid export membrane protein
MKAKQPTLTEHLFTGSLVIILFTVLASPFGYLIRIIFSRSLTTEEFGLFYAILGMFGFFVSYKDLGFGSAALYYSSRLFAQKKYQETWQAFFYSLVIEVTTSTILAVTVMLGSGFLARFYFKSELAVAVLPLFALMFVVESITLVLKRLFIGLKKVHYFSSFEPLRFGFTFICAGWLFMTGQTSLWAFSLIWLLSHVFTAMVGTLFFINSFRTMVSLPTWNASLFTKLKTYAIPSLINSFVHQLNNSTDVLFLTLVKGVTTVGVYNVTFPIMVIPTMIFSPLTRLFLPMIASLQDEAGGREKIRYFIELTLKIIPLVSLYFNVFIFLFADSTLATLFTYKWVEVARTPLMWMSIGYLGYILVSYLGLIIDGLGLVKQKMAITSSLAVINMIVTPLAIYLFDLLGLIMVNAVVQLTLIVLFIRLLAKHQMFEIPVNLYVKYAAFFGLVGGLVKLLDHSPKTLFEFLATGAIYTLLVGVFALNQKLIDPTTFAIIKDKVFSSKS